MKKVFIIIGFFAATTSVLAQPNESNESHQVITPIPQAAAYHAERALLGKQLFHDKRLSKHQDVACVSCHDLNQGGANSAPLAKGTANRVNEVNTPSVYNSIYHFRYQWDGGAKDYHELINNMITTPTLMGNNWQQVIKTIKKNPLYVEQFNRLFQQGVSQQTIVAALHEYQKKLITPNAKFDRYLMGDKTALNNEEVAGFKLFQSVGCVSCHQGRNVGGNLYEKLGIYKDYFLNKKTLTEADYGRFNVTGLEEDKYVFKVPSLRNVALTAPYFHDGSQATLEDAIQTMAVYQIGKELPSTYIRQIKAFLITLTGEALTE